MLVITPEAPAQYSCDHDVKQASGESVFNVKVTACQRAGSRQLVLCLFSAAQQFVSVSSGTNLNCQICLESKLMITIDMQSLERSGLL